jgi:ribosomal protein L34
MRWAGYVARMGGTQNFSLVTLNRRLHGRRRLTSEDNIKVKFKEVKRENVV